MSNPQSLAIVSYVYISSDGYTYYDINFNHSYHSFTESEQTLVYTNTIHCGPAGRTMPRKDLGP